MAKKGARALHITLGTMFWIPIFITIASGAAYRVCRAWFDLPKESVQWLMDVHTMSIIKIGSVYPILIGLGAVGMGLTGTIMFLFGRRATNLPPLKKYHRYFISIVGVPFAITAATGLLFAVLINWAPQYDSAEHTYAKLLMALHQGSWTVYLTPAVFVPLLGAVLMGVIWTGSLLLRDHYGDMVKAQQEAEAAKAAAGTKSD